MARGFNPEWMAILKKHQAMVPAGSAWRRWQQAAKDASAEYRGRGGGRSRRRENPDNAWMAWALIAGAGYLVYAWWQSTAGQEAKALVTNPRSLMTGGTGL